MRALKMLIRSLRLRCCVCGRGKMFRRWWMMHESCQKCGIAFERERGFFLGSIYFNYGITAFSLTAFYMAAYFSKLAENRVLLYYGVAYVVLFPLFFHPFARSLWSGFDQLFDPRENPSNTESNYEPK